MDDVEQSVRYQFNRSGDHALWLQRLHHQRWQEALASGRQLVSAAEVQVGDLVRWTHDESVHEGRVTAVRVGEPFGMPPGFRTAASVWIGVGGVNVATTLVLLDRPAG